MQKLTVALSLALALTDGTKPADAHLGMRCISEWLPPPAAQGRNAWAVKCGYLTKEEARELNDSFWFISFAGACAQYPHVSPWLGCERYAPISEAEACVPDLGPSAICSVG